MATLLNTALRGEQIEDATISGAHIIDHVLSPIKLDVDNSPIDGDVLTYNSSSGKFEWGSVGTKISNEAPSGTIDGVNTTFTTSTTPVGNSVEVFLNGLLQEPGAGNDYTISSGVITFASAPQSNDVILVSYLTSQGVGGGIYTDHGNLSGLLDDDHPQYIRVDGNRNFSGIVSYSNQKTFTNDWDIIDKKYVDDALAGISSDKISEGDSYVEVIDAGVGQIDFVVDSTQISNFTKAEQIVGRDGIGYLKVTPGDQTLDFFTNSQHLLAISTASQQLGTTSSYIKNDAGNIQLDIVQGGSNVAHFGPSDAYQRVGPTANARLEVNNSGNPTFAKLFGGDTNYLKVEQSAGGGGGTLQYFEAGTEIVTATDSYVRLGNSSTYARVNYIGGSFMVYNEGTRVINTTYEGLQLTSGTSINEFSIDGTLAGNSDDAVPTEKAVKTYVDNGLAGLSQDSISEGNSKVEVIDTGSGYVTVEVDGSERARFTDTAFTAASNILPEMTGASGTVSTRNIGSSSTKFNGIYCHDLYADAGSIYVNDKKVIEDVSDVITISTDAGQRLKLVTTGDSGDIYVEGQGGIQFHIPNTSSNKDITLSNDSPSGQINIGGSGQTIKLTGSIDISTGILSHSSLSNLTADDHTQYIKVDGSRAFTSAVGGILPTANNHLATKSYVDSKVTGLDWQDSVKDKDLNSPPSSPSTGDRYIVANSSTGSWAGHDGDVAEWNGSAWDFSSKSEGMAVWVEDEDVLYTYNGSSWVKFGSTITHNNTIGLQGGTVAEYYHLTAAQHTDLTDSGDSSLHYHASDRNLANATGTIDDTKHGNRSGGSLHSAVTTSVNGFMIAADKAKLDGIEDNATADQSPSEILTAIKSVDGSGSGLDADLLDGNDSSYFLNTSSTFGGDVSGTYDAIVVANDSHTHDTRYYTETEIDTWRNGTTQTEMGYLHGVTSDIQTQIDGKLSTTGKAADSDKLDGFDSSVFAQIDGSTIYTGQLRFTGESVSPKWNIGPTGAPGDDFIIYDDENSLTRLLIDDTNGNTRIGDSNTFFVDNVNSRVGIGTEGPEAALHIKNGNFRISRDDSYNNVLQIVYSDTYAPTHIFERSGGSESSKTATQDGWLLGGFQFRGYDGSTFPYSCAAIGVYAEENFTASGVGQGIRFKTTQNGTTSEFERMRITNDGNVGIGTTSPSYRLHVKSASNVTAMFESSGSNYGRIFFKDASGSSSIRNDGSQIVFESTGSATEIARFDSSGNLSLNKTYVGEIGSNFAGFSYTGFNDYDNYALLQGNDGTTYLNASDTKIITLRINNSEKLQVNNSGVSINSGVFVLPNGTSINEFSIDGTLAGNSDDAVPTEKAVKTYVDTNYYDKTTSDSRFVNVTGDTVTGNLVISGDLTVNGTTTTVNSETLSVADNIITLNSDFTSGTPTQNAGMEVYRGDSATVSLRWNEANDNWEITEDGSNFYKLWHQGNDGSGSGLDADLVDGLNSSQFIRSDAYDTVAGHTRWDDTYQVRLGTGSDLKIYHDSVSSYMDNVTGDFFIRAGATPSMRMTALEAGGVNLYYNGSGRLFTNSNGVEITNLEITGTTKTAGYFYAGTTDPTNTDRLNYDGYLYATKIYNAVYNDIADFQELLPGEKVEYGKCYFDSVDGAHICTERCQMGVIGIASDTYGFGVGKVESEGYAPFAVAGWVLAYVDKEYATGTPLTNDENGNLTEMSPAEKREFPERIVAIYKKKEFSEYWGPNGEVKVDGRHWVKVK